MITVYKNCNLLDGTENMTLRENCFVAVENGKIIGISDAPIKGDREVDLTGKYLMPGLINMHVHLPAGGKPKTTSGNTNALVKFVLSNALTRAVGLKMCQNYAMQELLSGVTTLRTVGGVGDFDTKLRDKINSGKADGPRILASNMGIGPVGGHMVGSVAEAVETEEACLEAVRRRKDEGVDLIKLMITGGVLDAKVKGEPGVLKMKPEFVKLCCDEAHRLGFHVAAHVESAEGVKVAVENGVDTIEHGAPMTQETLDLAKSRGVSYICTISPALPLAKFSRDVTLCSEMVQFNSNVVFDGIIEGTKEALKNNIPVGLGTDTGCPFITHYNMWRELEYFKKYVGVSAEYALYCATLSNARIAGVDKLTGSVEVGKSADMLIANSNPLENFAALKTPYMVIKEGKEFTNLTVKKSAEGEKLLDEYMPE